MDQLDQIISKHHLLKHSFYQRWMEGKLTQPELQKYVVNYFPHIEAFPTYVSAAHSHAEDMKLRQALLENLIEEEQGEENHPELWLRFAECLGVSREDVKSKEKTPEAYELVRTFKGFAKKDLPSALGALYAYESQVPEISTQKIEGLKKHYGITSKKGTQFFEVHQTADVYHSQTTKAAIQAMSEEDQSIAMEAAGKTSVALWNFLSSCEDQSMVC